MHRAGLKQVMARGRVTVGTLALLVPAAVAVLASVSVAGSAWWRGFPLDDAWIHMVYGLAVRREFSLAYNAGVAATGCTSPLWALIVGAVHGILGASGPSETVARGVKVLGVGLHAATAVLSALLARDAVAGRRARTVAAVTGGIAVAAVPALALAAVSGMEVSLTAALLTGALLVAGRGRPFAAGVLAGLATLARPECVVAVPAVAALAVLRGGALRSQRWRGATRALGATLVPAVALPAVLLVRNAAVSGRPLPATYYAKAGMQGHSLAGALSSGFGGVYGALAPTEWGLFWLLVAGAVLAGVHGVRRMVQRRRVDSPVALPSVVACVTAITGLAYAMGSSLVAPPRDGTMFYFQRYLLPPVPLLVVAAVASAVTWTGVATRWIARAAPPVRAQGYLWALRIATGTVLMVALSGEVRGWRVERVRYGRDVAVIDRVQVTLARYIAANTPTDAVVWSVDAGAMRYWGQRRVVDLMGLNTPELVRDGRVPDAWAADVLVIAPAFFAVASRSGTLDAVLTARPWGRGPAPDRLAAGRRQALLRCHVPTVPGTDPTLVLVDLSRQPFVRGRCRTY